jgi:hypothetical protein
MNRSLPIIGLTLFALLLSAGPLLATAGEEVYQVQQGFKLVPAIIVLALLGVYVGVGLYSRVSSTSGYWVAGQGIGKFGNGAAIASDWMSAASFMGVAGDAAAIRARMLAIKAEREAAQPLRVATGGSTFKNPPGHKAWQLIDAAGCRELRHGKAMVSGKHCNFLINTGGASAAEIEELGEMVRARVQAQCGIALDWEIHRIGRSIHDLEAAA